MMKYGVALPFNDPQKIAGTARLLEDSGWDALFLGDAIWCMDPFIALTAAAMTTQRLHLGTMVLCAPLRAPWQVASQSVALDHLSNGRLILGMGTGATWMGWHAFPDAPMDIKTRAERLDEHIDILTELYQRKQFDYDGQQYHLQLTTMDLIHYPPKPVQQPRIPIWIPGAWPRKKSMKRVLKCDGVLPAKMGPDGQLQEVKPADLKEMRDYVETNRDLTTSFDYVIEGKTTGMSRDQKANLLNGWAEAGATWWIESLWGLSEPEIMDHLRQGPPGIG